MKAYRSGEAGFEVGEQSRTSFRATVDKCGSCLVSFIAARLVRADFRLLYHRVRPIPSANQGWPRDRLLASYSVLVFLPCILRF